MAGEGGVPDRRRFRTWWLKPLLAVISLGVVLAAAELVARLALPPPQLVEVAPTVIREPRPGPTEEREQERGIDVVMDWSGHHGVRLYPGLRATIRNHSLNGRDVVIETNSLGLRHPELADKAPGEYRVLVVGDSITFCDYVSFEESYTALLERRLAGGDRRVVVINAGLPGASGSDELYHYLEIRDAVDPDLVLVAMYLNDAQSSEGFYARSLPRPLSSSRLAVWLASRVTALGARLWADQTVPEIDPGWIEEFRAGRDLRSGDMWHTRDGFDFEIYNARTDFGLAWSPQSWLVLERIMSTLLLAAQQQGHQVVACLFPVHVQVKGTIEDFRPQQQFLEMCRSLDLPCLDLVPALRASWQRDGAELYFDHCHLTPHGNGVVADALAEWLAEQRLVPR